MRTDENRENREESREAAELRAARRWRDAARRSRRLRGTPRARDAPPPRELLRPEALSLGGRGLTELPTGLGACMRGVRVLVLRRNQLSALPRALQELPRLQELDLSHNLLGGMGGPGALDGLERLAGLRRLCVSHNRLRELPLAVGALDALEELDISHNLLGALPPAAARMRSLRALDADHNLLPLLPPSLLALEALEELDLSGNRFSELPPELGALGGARLLWLSGLGLGTLPDSLGRLTRLESLMLDGNLLCGLPHSLCRLTRLRMLNLSSNRLRTLPEPLLRMRALEELYLSRNLLTCLPRGLGRLGALVSLWLDHNALTHLPPSLSELRCLEELLLQGNKLRALTLRVAALAHLRVLRLDGNPLLRPPAEVCAGGVAAVARYQEEHPEPEAEPRLKLVLLGARGSGKTRVRERLVAEEDGEDCGGSPEHCALSPDEQSSHPGLHLLEWRSASGLCFHIYELPAAGSSGLHPLSPFFLSPGALYVLVVNLRAYAAGCPASFHAHVGHFLRVLSARAPGSVLFMVGAQADRCSAAELEEKLLDIHARLGQQERRDAFVLEDAEREARRALELGEAERASGGAADLPFCGVSDWNLRRRLHQLQRLRESRLRVLAPVLGAARLRRKLLDLPLLRRIFPELERAPPGSWTLLEELLVHAPEPEPWLDGEAAARVGQQAGLGGAELRAALAHLQRGGSLLLLPDCPPLRDWVFHRPRRLVAVLNLFFFVRDERTLLRLLLRGERADAAAAPCGARQQLPDARPQLQTFLRHGRLCSAAMRRLLAGAGEQLVPVLELLERMGLCYRLDPAWLQFPDPNPEREPKPEPDPGLFTEQPLHVQFRFPLLFPPGLLTRLRARIHAHVGERRDGPQHVLAFRGKVPVLLRQRARALTVESHAALPNMWTAWQAVAPLLREVKELLREWPGLLHEAHVLCGKCVRSGSAEPHLFPGELLTQPRPEGLSEVVCPKHAERVAVAMVYPPSPPH